MRILTRMVAHMHAHSFPFPPVWFTHCWNGQALMRALMAVDNDGGEALQTYLVKEHEENSQGRDGSTLMPEAMRARARVPRYAIDVVVVMTAEAPSTDARSLPVLIKR